MNEIRNRSGHLNAADVADPLAPLREHEDALTDIAADDVPDADLAHIFRELLREEKPDPARVRRLQAGADRSSRGSAR